MHGWLVVLLWTSCSLGCELDQWGLPISGHSLSAPAVLPIDLMGPDGGFYPAGVELAEVVLYTISYINHNILNGTGYCLNTTIIDSRGLVNETVRGALQIIKHFSDNSESCTTQQLGEEQVVGFLGAAITDNSIAMANLCNVLQLPQVSYASTSTELDDREAYPFFLRTVPSDQLQAKAMVEIISKSPEWRYIGVIVADTSYGSAGLSAFLTEASRRSSQEDLCIAFQYKLENPAHVVKQVVDYVNKTRVSVIVLFSDKDQSTAYFSELHKTRTTLLAEGQPEETRKLWTRLSEMVYIGSDSWSKEPELFNNFHSYHNSSSAQVFSNFIGLTVYTKEILGFKDHLATLNRTHYNGIYKRMGGSPNLFEQWWDKITEETVFADVEMDPHSSTTADATLAVGWGLRNYLDKYSPNGTNGIDTISLHKCLEAVNFTSITGNVVSFGRVGGNSSGGGSGDSSRYNIVEYRNGNFTKVGTYIHGTLRYTNPYSGIPSQCSSNCPAGKKEVRTGVAMCCHDCEDCEDHHVSQNGVVCVRCNETMTHNANRTACIYVLPDYISYTSVFAFVLYGLVGAGVTSAVATTILFVVKFNSPVVQGHGVFVYVTLLATCTLLLSSTPLYLGLPCTLTCNLIISVPILGLSILLSGVICLTKSVILRLREFTEDNFYLLQMSIVLLIFLVEAALTVGALLDNPYHYNITELERGVVEGRCEGDMGLLHYLLFGSLILLSLVCLVLCTVGRNITENYNEGKFLFFQTIAMYIVIVAFIPTAYVLKGSTLNAAWAVTIVLVCYIVLAVLFIPKVYIIVCRPYKNQFLDELLSDTEEDKETKK